MHLLNLQLNLRANLLTKLLVCLVLAGPNLVAQTRVVTTVADLADLAERIGGERVKVQCLTRGHEDLHLVNVRPSLVVKLRRAEIFMELGFSAEHAWVPALMRAARNRKIQPGKPGFINCSAGIRPIRVYTSRSRADGPDLHPAGNPHYNLDPVRMRLAARNICRGLKRAIPDHAAEFDARLASWEKELDRRLATWRAKLAPLKGACFIEYHSAWVYFASSFGFDIVGRLEPKPGMAPTPSHLKQMIQVARDRKVGLIVARPQNLDIAKKVVAEAGGKAVSLQLGSSRQGELKGWFTFMDHIVEVFAANLRRS